MNEPITFNRLREILEDISQEKDFDPDNPPVVQFGDNLTLLGTVDHFREHNIIILKPFEMPEAVG